MILEEKNKTYCYNPLAMKNVNMVSHNYYFKQLINKHHYN